MTNSSVSITSFLKERGLIKDQTCPSFDEKSNFYVGFDPTADSLHVGSLLPIVIAKFLISQGKNVTLLVGNATAIVGDPSGKSKERPAMLDAVAQDNAKKVSKQLKELLPQAVIVHNKDWLGDIGFLQFVTQVGKHVSVKKMLGMESVRSRLATEEGMSFQEFAYSLLQGFDFASLAKTNAVEVQFGGSDQWGNILMGIDIANRTFDIDGLQGFTFPLVTKQDGTKFGKSETGTIWLDPTKTTPFEFFQFFKQLSDEEVKNLFPKFCLHLEKDVVDAVFMNGEETPRLLQTLLAVEMTRLLYGEEGMITAAKETQIKFGKGSTDIPTDRTNIIEVSEADISLVEFIKKAEWATSNTEARKLLKGGGVKIDDEAKLDDIVLEKQMFPNGIWISKGKKHRKFLRFV